jgi:hypothetical protein
MKKLDKKIGVTSSFGKTGKQHVKMVWLCNMHGVSTGGLRIMTWSWTGR